MHFPAVLILFIPISKAQVRDLVNSLCPAWQPLDLLHVNKKGELPIGSPLMDLTHRWKKPYKPEATQFAAHCLQTAGSADMKVRRKTAH